MFYYKTGLQRRVRVHPKYIGGENDIHEIVKKVTIQELKNSFCPETGYCVSPVSISVVGEGFCVPLLGFLEFGVEYEAIMIFPIVGEVIFAHVLAVTETCVIFQHACMFGVVRSYSLNDEDFFKFEEVTTSDSENGETEESNKGMFRSQVDSDKVIQRGTSVKLRIMRRVLGGNGFFLVGSMVGKYLGPVADPPSPISALDFEVSVDLSNVKDEIIPHQELQKVWKKDPYNVGPAPLSPPMCPVKIDDQSATIQP